MWPVDRDKTSLRRKYSQKSVINISNQKRKNDTLRSGHMSNPWKCDHGDAPSDSCVDERGQTYFLMQVSSIIVMESQSTVLEVLCTPSFFTSVFCFSRRLSGGSKGSSAQESKATGHLKQVTYRTPLYFFETV